MNNEQKLISTETPVPITWLDIAWKARVTAKGTTEPRSADSLVRANHPDQDSFFTTPKTKVRGQGCPRSVQRKISRMASGSQSSVFRGHGSRGQRGLSSLRTSRGFTLIELLVVIAIIAILAALLLPAVSGARKKALTAKAKLDVQKIVTAIHKYESDYNRLPASKDAMTAALAAKEDFTYGTTGVANNPNQGSVGAGFLVPGAANQTVIASDALTQAPLGYQTNNSELMCVLLDYETFPGPANIHTINYGHVKNTQRTKFLNATIVDDQISAGVGSDLVYRDPWKQPYIITLDLNNDEKARDPFYRSPFVTEDLANPGRGLNGLIKSTLGNFYEINQPVVVWSAGEDITVDPNTGNAPGGKANLGVNKNNVISWGQ